MGTNASSARRRQISLCSKIGWRFEPRDGRLSLKVALWPLGQCTGDLNDSTRWRSRCARCMPTRLSRYVRFPVRRQERQAGRCDRRSRSSDDARRTLRQAQRLCRASLQPQPAALPDAAHRRQRQRSVRTHLVERCSRGNQKPVDGHHRGLRRASDHAPRLSRAPGDAQRAHGGRRVLQSPGIDRCRKDLLRVRVFDGLDHDRRPVRGAGPGEPRLREVHHRVGHEHDQHQPARLALHPGGAEKRCEDRGHRSRAHAHRQSRPTGTSSSSRVPTAHSRWA